MTMRTHLVLFLASFAIAACGASGDEAPDLMVISESTLDGPDEFAILPTEPLVIPEDLTALPTPTPGQSNRTDQAPKQDAIAALGGNPAVLSRASNDGALVRYAGRYGVSGNIRETLSEADLRFRQNNDGLPLERLFNVNIYFDTYEPFSLDQHRELERLRRAGIRTSAVPPEPGQ